MKYFFGVLFSFLTVTTAVAQVGLFEGQSVSSPQQYGETFLKYMVKADNLMKLGAFEGAILAYDNALARNPTNAEVYIKRAIAHYRMGREHEAELDVQQALTINPYAADLHGMKGVEGRLSVMAFEPIELIVTPKTSFCLSYLKNKWYNDELRDVRLTKENVNEIEAPVVVQELLQLLDRKEYDWANTLLLDLNSWKPVHYNLLGTIQKEKGNWKNAYEYFEKVIEQDVFNPYAYYMMSGMKIHEKDYKTALELVEKALLKDPEMMQAHFQKAVLYKLMNKPNQSLSAYDYITAGEEEIDYEYHINKAITQKLTGDVTGAMISIEKAIALQLGGKADANAYKIKGNIHLLINDYVQAIADYNKAIELDGQFAEAYFNRAIAFLLNYNYADACYDFQKSVELGYFKGEEKLKYFCNF